MPSKKVLIPQPKSYYLLIQCPNCGNEQITFSHSSLKVKCLVCDNILVEPKGGKAKILGKIIKEFR